MKSTKHFALVALLVVGTTLSASTPARAQSTITLTNVAAPADPDSDASGQATLSDVAYSGSFPVVVTGYSMTEYDFYTGYLTVRCSGLTPRATYSIGPTWTGPVFNTRTGRTTIETYYSSVKASNTGTLELNVNVRFIGGGTYWYWFAWGSSGGWVYSGSWDESYGFSVARKQGK